MAPIFYFVWIAVIYPAEGACPAGIDCPAEGTSMLQKNKLHAVATDTAFYEDQANAGETKTIYVVFNTFEDTNNSAQLILDAMKDAGLTMNEWKPSSAHHVPDHNATFPVTMDMDFERRPPVSAQADPTSQALLQEEEEEQEEQEEALTFNQTLVDLLLDEDESSELLGKKPTKRQLKWAARAISKLESSICSRHRENKYAAYARSSYGKWWWHSCASGYDDVAGICYKKCASGYYADWFLCHQSCGNREDTMSECIERCAYVPGSPSPIDTTCSLFYCGESTGDCVKHGALIALSFAEMFANFIPGGKALTGIKKAVKKGTMAAMKKAMKKAVKDVAKKMLKKARKNLKKVMKEKKKDLKDELKEAILQGGAEEIAEVFIAKTDTSYLKDVALEILKEVDPTGIADVVGAFEADRCRDKVIDPFPEA